MAEASPIPIVETAPEEWRPILGFEGAYEVSNHARVRRICDRYARPLREPTLKKPSLMKIGYHRVDMWFGEAQRKAYLHALVAEAFLGPRPPGHQIAHLDGHGDNSVLSNLAYVTPTENNAHKRIHGTDRLPTGPDHHSASLTADQVREMRALRKRFGKRKLPMREIGRMFGVSRITADAVCNRRKYTSVA